MAKLTVTLDVPDVERPEELDSMLVAESLINTEWLDAMDVEILTAEWEAE